MMIKIVLQGKQFFHPPIFLLNFIIYIIYILLKINPKTIRLISTLKFESIPKSTLKSSQEKALRKKILEDCPLAVDILDIVWPKKAGLLMGKMKP